MTDNENGDLAAILRRYGTDKVHYAEAYEAFLRCRRLDVKRLLEIGIGTLRPGEHSSMAGLVAPHYRPGGSLRSWRDYFPNAEIIGIDIQPDTQFTESRIRTFICDSTNSQDVGSLIERNHWEPFDLIIDDGSHRPEDQLASLDNLFTVLANHGLYVIEDVDDELLARRNELLAIAGGAVIFTSVEYNPIFIYKAPRSQEFHLRSHGNCAASLLTAPDAPGWVRLAIESAATGKAYDVQVNQPFHEFRAGDRYSVDFEAKADKPRGLGVGVAAAHAPWSNIGMYEQVQLSEIWQTFALEFTASASDRNGRIHFDAGESDVSVELRSLSVRSLPA